MLGRIHLLGKGNPIKTMDEFAGWDKETALQTVKSLEDKISQIEHKDEFDALAQRAIKLKEELINKNTVSLSDLNLKKCSYESYGQGAVYTMFGDCAFQNVDGGLNVKIKNTSKYPVLFDKTAVVTSQSCPNAQLSTVNGGDNFGVQVDAGDYAILGLTCPSGTIKNDVSIQHHFTQSIGQDSNGNLQIAF